MRTSGKILNVALALCCVSALMSAQAADDQTGSASAPVQTTTGADNSSINARDKNGATLTPQDQSNQKGDLQVLAAVRRAVVHDKTLSISAHNIKIVVVGGVATLRGPVNSDDEKSKLGQIATQVAGVTSVDNQLEVKSH